MRKFLYLPFIIVLGVFIYNFYHLAIQYIALKKDYNDSIRKIAELNAEQNELLANLKYYSDKDNLIKELRSKFDYKKPGEKLIKIK